MNIDTTKITEMLISYAPKVAGAILTIIIGFWLASYLAALVKRRMEKANVDPSLVPFMGSVISVGLKILVLLSAASMFGFVVTSFIAIFSALMFAIGMALQGNLSHMAAGILILFFKPFRVGDFIVAQGYSGVVKEIQIFNTILTTLDNRIVIIPNGAITSGPIENLTANEKRIVPMTFGIGYSDDIDKAREVILRVAADCPYIDQDEEVKVFINALADSSVNFTVRPWCKTEDYWNVHFYMHENIKKEFDKASIGIPFPQMDVHLFKSND